MAEKLPWFRWYAEDWLSDEKLRACSLAARGLWIDMLSLMHKNDRRGFLQLNGTPPTPEQIARMAGSSAEEVSRLLAELKIAGVFSVSEDGSIYSRRMTRDEHIRTVRSEAGAKGGLVTGVCLSKMSSKRQAKPKQTPKQTSGSGSSSSPSGEEGIGPEAKTGVGVQGAGDLPEVLPKQNEPESIPAILNTPEFLAVWARWQQHRKEIRKPLKPTTATAQLKELAGWGVARAVAALEYTIAKGWTGYREPEPSLFSTNGHSRPQQETPRQRLERVKAQTEGNHL